ncbi:MAG: bifunctional (p)ppGpp synthetase/guanosine-3',5'-bis(diphosphate) 3'-pyrophosphohydrolase, partial [Clostridia bacterium]|nr:bifunctional (p)ppGpp synthetase/guanosine-3',5'-bis(diphosphate) 3'-pyrophosphohydrolase [Clostridia bacterium]
TKLKIRDRVAETIPDVYLEGRVKSINGIYRKMYMQGRSFDEIYDIYAVRVIVNSIIDCYNVLGIIHDMYTPIPNRFKDYISTPKQNMYQSLHTTVLSKDGIAFEVQIRTWDMHHTAEYGIAAHWKYKLGMKDGKQDALEDRVAWIRRLLENQSEDGDATELISSIKTDIAPEEVFVFTPKGDVIRLPMGATVIDFAYAIHSAVGNRMVGAKVGNRIVPIDYQVKIGDVIEILTTKEAGQGPSRDWLNIVKTSEAKTKIRQWFKKEKRGENIERGRQELEKEFRKNNMVLTEEEAQGILQNVARRQHMNSLEDLYASIGYGGVQIARILPRLKDEYNRLVKERGPSEPVVQTTPVVEKVSNGIVVDGVPDCLVKFSRCCNPLPGDEIIGFVTRGFGVSIHNAACKNVPRDIRKAAEPDRWVRVRWASNVSEDFKAVLEIHCTDREGLLADVTMHLSNMHIMIHSLNCRGFDDGSAVIYATVTVHGRDHIDLVIRRLMTVKNVHEIRRT